MQKLNERQSLNLDYRFSCLLLEQISQLNALKLPIWSFHEKYPVISMNTSG